jgi:hypothetical protein
MSDDLSWRKASRSGSQGGNCVEVAFGPDGRAAGRVRDSKRPEAGHLAVELDAFAAFLADIKMGRLGHLA